MSIFWMSALYLDESTHPLVLREAGERSLRRRRQGRRRGGRRSRARRVSSVRWRGGGSRWWSTVSRRRRWAEWRLSSSLGRWVIGLLGSGSALLWRVCWIPWSGSRSASGREGLNAL